ncbi:MAG: pentapeptide repeat-containing protein [Cyanobacteria bacterium P01_H01_bin.105]
MLKGRSSEIERQQRHQLKRTAQTKQIAYQLYRNRQLLKKKENPTEDWQTAENISGNLIRWLLFKVNQPFIKIEKRYWEPLLRWADNQSLLSFLGIIGNISIIFAVFIYIGSEKQRRDAEIYQAWQVITSAHGQAGSGGRRRALEFLNASPGANWRRKFPWFCAPMAICLWPPESLDGINLSSDSVSNSTRENDDDSRQPFSGVYLFDVLLPKASLRSANFSGAELKSANFSGADLRNAKLSKAILIDANLSKAVLQNTNLSEAVLPNANLSEAVLENTDLSEANL